MSIVCTFSTAAGGVWIEEGNHCTPPSEAGDLHPLTRCFRFSDDGFAEYAYLTDVQSSGERARFYGFGMGKVQPGDFTLC